MDGGFNWLWPSMPGSAILDVAPFNLFWLSFWICFYCHAYFGSDREHLYFLVAPSHCLAYMLLLAQNTEFPLPLASLNTVGFYCVKSCVSPLLKKMFSDLTSSVAPYGLFLILFSFWQMLWVRAHLPHWWDLSQIWLFFFSCQRVVSSRNLIHWILFPLN